MPIRAGRPVAATGATRADSALPMGSVLHGLHSPLDDNAITLSCPVKAGFTPHDTDVRQGNSERKRELVTIHPEGPKRL